MRDGDKASMGWRPEAHEEHHEDQDRAAAVDVEDRQGGQGASLYPFVPRSQGGAARWMGDGTLLPST